MNAPLRETYEGHVLYIVSEIWGTEEQLICFEVFFLFTLSHRVLYQSTKKARPLGLGEIGLEDPNFKIKTCTLGF